MLGTPLAGVPRRKHAVALDGLRKVRFADSRRAKGKRGGLRVIYYHWIGGPEFWLFTLYDKDEMTDLSPTQRAD